MNSRQVQSLFNRRLILFSVWALLMFVTMVIVIEIDLRMAKFVPIFFLPLMVPIALFPFKTSPRNDR